MNCVSEVVLETKKNALKPRKSKFEFAFDQLSILLTQIDECLTRLGTDFAGESIKLHALQSRLQEGKLHLAVLGQFKRGKSTLINALLGEELLPTAVVPLTSVPTFIYPEDRLRIRVTFLNGHPPEEISHRSLPESAEFLSRFVTEKLNPQNRLGVSSVEVFHPSSLLQKGVIFIDTPGIGSTFRHNTETTLQFLPQCDAALFLISADPPITEVEVEFLTAVRSQVPHLFFILNKADYLTPIEREEALQFFKKVLKEQVGLPEEVPVFPVSARMGLQAKLLDDIELWRQSGLEEVETYLIDFLLFQKNTALQRSITIKTIDLIREVLLQLQLSVRALQLPMEDLANRLHIFQNELHQIERQRVISRDLLLGDKKRLTDFLEAQSLELSQKAGTHLLNILHTALKSQTNPILDEAQIQASISQAVPAFFEKELEDLSCIFQQKIEETLLPYQQQIDELIEKLQKTAAEIFDLPFIKSAHSGTFELERRPYWVNRQWSALLTPIPVHWINWFLPTQFRRTIFEKQMKNQVEVIVSQNVENLRWATLQNLDKTFCKFELNLEERLLATIQATHGAMQAAFTKRQECAQSIDLEVVRFKDTIQTLESIENELSIISSTLERTSA